MRLLCPFSQNFLSNEKCSLVVQLRKEKLLENMVKLIKMRTNNGDRGSSILKVNKKILKVGEGIRPVKPVTYVILLKIRIQWCNFRLQNNEIRALATNESNYLNTYLYSTDSRDNLQYFVHFPCRYVNCVAYDKATNQPPFLSEICVFDLKCLFSAWKSNNAVQEDKHKQWMTCPATNLIKSFQDLLLSSLTMHRCYIDKQVCSCHLHLSFIVGR